MRNLSNKLKAERAIVALSSVTLLAASCGGDDNATTGKPASPTSQNGGAAAAELPTGTPPPEGRTACAAQDLHIAGVQNIDRTEGRTLFIRIFNDGDACWLDGNPAIDLRKDGDWVKLDATPSDAPVTGGVEWTGIFDPKLVAVTTLTAPMPGDGSAGSAYDAVRVILPNDGGDLVSDIRAQVGDGPVVVSAFEADSQGG